MLQLDQSGSQSEFLLQRFIGISPLVVVQLFGLVWAIISLRSAHKRAPASCLLIGLCLLTFTLLGRPFVDAWLLIGSDLPAREIQSRMTTLGILDLSLDSVGIVLMIVAALAWRTNAITNTANVTSEQPFASTNAPPITMPPLSPVPRLLLMYVPLVISVFASFGSLYFMQQRRTQGPAFLLLGLSVILLIVGVIAFAMTIHALWKTIQPPPMGVGVQGVARTTPAKAVGFLFIPLFSFYWIFQVWVGLAHDTNKTLDQRGVNAPRLSPGLAIAICVCTLLSMIPYVGIIAWIPNLIMMPMFLWRAFGTANALRGYAPGVTGASAL